MNPSTNLNLNLEPARWWLPLAILGATFVLEAWQVWRQPTAASPPTVGPEGCYELCAWSGAPVQSWGGTSCTCGPIAAP